MSFAGDMNFNPMIDTITGPDGKPFKFTAPSGDRLPNAGFTPGDLSYAPTSSPEPIPETEIAISPDSTRLEVLAPFPSFFEAGPAELPEMKCLMRIRGKW
jgi:homoaconitase